MPTLKNKKICEDVPPQLDLGPRPSFDSAHLDVPSDEFPVYLLQNGVKMINEPPSKAAAKCDRIPTSMELDSSLLLDTTSTMQR